jgi:hypothetical protein
MTIGTLVLVPTGPRNFFRDSFSGPACPTAGQPQMADALVDADLVALPSHGLLLYVRLGSVSRRESGDVI